MLEQSDVEQIWSLIEADPTLPVTVDLAQRTVAVEGLSAHFEVDDYTRWRLMEGLDDIGISLQHEAAISAFEATRPAFTPATQTR